MTDTPWYEFYTDAGDAYCDTLVQLVRVDGPLSVERARIELEAIQRLCEQAGHGEAYDTACREAIFRALTRQVVS